MQIFILYVLVLASSLQLLMTASSLPISVAESNGDSPPANNSDATDCHCNGKNLTVNGNFLSNWSISIISMSADNLRMLTDYKEVRKCSAITCVRCVASLLVQCSYYGSKHR